jgi:type IV secretory pathway VirB4 component
VTEETAKRKGQKCDRLEAADRVTRAIDEERRAHFEREQGHFESRHAIIATYRPTEQRRSRLSKYLYSDEGQDIAGRNYYRPTSDRAKAKYDKQFPKLTLFTIDQAFGGWAKADKAHFADGGSFDQIYVNK